MRRLVFILAAVWLLTLSSFATSPEELLYESLKIDELNSVLPSETIEMSDRIFEDGFSFEKLLSLSPQQLLKAVSQEITAVFSEYKSSLFLIITAVFLCAVLNAIEIDTGQNQVFGLICVLTITAVLLKPILGCLKQSCQTIFDTSRFMLVYIPVYAAVMVTSGAAVGAAAYQTVLLAASQVINALSTKVFVPLVQGFLLLSLSRAFGKNKGVSSLCIGVKKFICWGLCFITTVFSGFLSIQSSITSAADGAHTKTAKFLAGSFVPIIGGAFSDALSAMQGSVQIIKTTVGGFGIAAVLLAFAPILVKLTVFRAAIWLCKIIGEILSAEQASGILSSFGDVLSVVLALVLCVMMIFIISTAIMMNTVSAI